MVDVFYSWVNYIIYTNLLLSRTMMTSMKEIHLEKTWKKALGEYLETEAFVSLMKFVQNEYSSQRTIYPSFKNIFSAFDLTPWNKVRVVILGQDPYHGTGQAHGLAFSVPESIPLPPSLRNIYKELSADLGIDTKKRSGNLAHWADQGVLLLNSVLTVEADKAASHAKKGWELFTDYIIEKLSNEKEHLVFILWGSYAQKKGSTIDHNKHLVITSPHPSPLSSYRGFFGSQPFSQTNTYLESHNYTRITW